MPGRSRSTSSYALTTSFPAASILEAHFPGAFELSRRTHTRKMAADDDILDALAALWTAGRLHSRQARAIPEGAVAFDSVGLPMTIWA